MDAETARAQKNSAVTAFYKHFSPVERRYLKGEIIAECSPEKNIAGIVENGTVYLAADNSDGQRRIIAFYGKGDFVCDFWAPSGADKAFYLYAKTQCKISVARLHRIISSNNELPKHDALLLSYFAKNAVRKNIIHIDVLCQQNLRSKLLCFFEYMKNEKYYNRKFTLPLPLTDLADYIAADRSAMMREIKKLNDENIISSDKRKISLLF